MSECKRCGSSNRWADQCSCPPERKRLEPIAPTAYAFDGDQIDTREVRRAWRDLAKRVDEVGGERAAEYFDEVNEHEMNQVAKAKVARTEHLQEAAEIAALYEMDHGQKPPWVTSENPGIQETWPKYAAEEKARRREKGAESAEEKAAPAQSRRIERPPPYVRPPGPPRSMSAGKGARGGVSGRHPA